MIYTVSYIKNGITHRVYDPRLANSLDVNNRGEIVSYAKFGIYNTKLTTAVNSAGSFVFTVPSTSEVASVLACMEGAVVVKTYDGEAYTTVFIGRIVKMSRNFVNDITCECEGALACLNDTAIAEYNVSGTAAARLTSIVGLRYGSGSPFTISAGTCTVSGSGEYSGQFGSTLWACISNDLLSRFGGYIVPRYDGDSTVYVDYFADISTASAQGVSFAVNLLDFTDALDGTQMYNEVIPRGKDRLTISSIANGWYNTSGEQTTEGAADAVYYKFGTYMMNVADKDKHGVLCLAYEDSAIETAANLFADAISRLNASSGVFPRTITVSAADLASIDDSVSEFKVGTLVAVTSAPHGLSVNMPMSKIEMDILDPVHAVLTLGVSEATASGSIARASGEAASFCAGQDIHPERVSLMVGTANVADLQKTSDGRGVFTVRSSAAPSVDSVKLYAMSSGLGGIQIRKSDGSLAVQIHVQNGQGVLRLYKADGTYTDFTP